MKPGEQLGNEPAEVHWHWYSLVVVQDFGPTKVKVEKVDVRQETEKRIDAPQWQIAGRPRAHLPRGSLPARDEPYSSEFFVLGQHQAKENQVGRRVVTLFVCRASRPHAIQRDMEAS